MDKNKALPHIAILSSIKIHVEPGKTYFWCSCGLSKNQPFCDGAHSGTGFSPIEYVSNDSKLVGFCGCKHSKKPPICDGSHKNPIP
jgi:CDGSH iron-sulfur domain-containing protein 3